jgi:toxin-antitoxin system PIN domain toxin
VKLPDLNVLIHAVDESSDLHANAKSWLEDTLSGTETVAMAWTVLLGFVRLTTRSAVFERPLTVEEAFDLVDGWLERPSVVVVHPTERHLTILRRLLVPLGTAGNLTTDAHLAAMSIELDAELCSTDADFSRFPDVRWTNPLT